ncbi:MAG: hypothetical protein HY782_14260 [Chloroflexi bacterium]|nr:hypothetical protein [Chloroflexota bacterium]
MKWKTLRHNGVAFPPDYDYRGRTVQIKGEPFKLDPLQEEMLMAWAKKKDTPYVLDSVFQQNFLGDLKKILPERFAGITLADIDWTELHAIADRDKTANLAPEEKKKRSEERKALREELKAKHGAALIDDIETEIGAYLVEPPGILMGRGAHPLRGKWKARVQPEAVTLNLDEAAPVPPAPDGHQWGKIVHEHNSMWIASWYDELSAKRKYVWLADSSHLRQERDKEKYLKASKLESGLERVRAKIREGMDHRDARIPKLEKEERKLQEVVQKGETAIHQATAKGDTAAVKRMEDELAKLRIELERSGKQRETGCAVQMKKRQIATVCYLIDRLAMRVGDEKDEDEADTVGASTLRVEHVTIDADRIEFDFLGKDSVQWQKFLPATDGEAILARNLQDFMQGKQPGEQIFHQIGSTHVNRFLGEIVPGLTAKVFRTYHATTTVRKALKEKDGQLPNAPAFEKEYTAKLANLQAAITCNHKRTPPKNWEENLAKKEKALEQLKAARSENTKFAKEIENRETALKKLSEEQAKFAAEGPRLVRAKETALAELQQAPTAEDEKEIAKLEKQRAAAAQALEKAKEDFEKKTARLRERVAKARETLETAKQAPQKAEEDYQERLAKAQRQLELAKQTRDYNLGTSLKNYIDPRVYKAWGDYVGFEWKRLYTKALQRKFAWVNQSRAKWSPSGEIHAEADDQLEDHNVEVEAEALADE